MTLDAGALALEREVELVRSAIDMVASGFAPAVTLGGLQFGDALLGVATSIGGQAGVRVVPLWAADDSRTDIRVERQGNG